MKIKSIIPIVALATVSMTSVAQNPQSQQLRSGLDMSNMDNSVKPQDDFFHYAWIFCLAFFSSAPKYMPMNSLSP